MEGRDLEDQWWSSLDDERLATVMWDISLGFEVQVQGGTWRSKVQGAMCEGQVKGSEERW